MITTFTSNAEINKIYDVVVVGGGIAGLVLANNIAKMKSVVLLEAGDMEYSERSQKIYAGKVLGDGTLYAPLDMGRWRALGGTSNIWGGACVDLEAFDFEKRDYIPRSGWPIDLAALSKYHSEALAILGVEGMGAGTPIVGSKGNLIQFARGVSKRPFVKDTYYENMNTNPNIDLFLNANVAHINLNDNADRVKSLSVKSYDFEKPAIDVEGENYVIAMGAIENVRTLLNSNSRLNKGIGNARDLVGRYFMDHPWSGAAHYVLFHNDPNYFTQDFTIRPSRRFVEAQRIGNFYCGISAYESKDGALKSYIKDLICSYELSADLLKRIKKGFECGIGRMELFIEQAPNFESRISLGNDVDELGNRRVELDWNMSDLDGRTLRELLFEIGKYMADDEVGRVWLAPHLLEQDIKLRKYLSGGHHHLGGVRMGHSPDDGVVDSNCKVYGINNLFVAGSGVFPTSGAGNPTFTIVKLALRLSDHLLGGI